MVLVFDREERLADFTGGIAPYAALPGRVIAGMLKGQGIGLGVNLGVAPSSMLLPPEAMDWLAETLDGRARRGGGACPRRSMRPIGARGAGCRAGRQAGAGRGAGRSAAVLAGVVYADGRRGHLLAFSMRRRGPRRRWRARWARRWSFPGLEAGELDVVFLAAGDAGGSGAGAGGAAVRSAGARGAGWPRSARDGPRAPAEAALTASGGGSLRLEMAGA